MINNPNLRKEQSVKNKYFIWNFAKNRTCRFIYF